MALVYCEAAYILLKSWEITVIRNPNMPLFTRSAHLYWRVVYRYSGHHVTDYDHPPW